jgi:alkanesulfonate monooxygenase SsuD/methylene tetrahydromethanopterin reductase-like flavin-dependent oxidoreductase (luciferase family)
MVEPQSGMTYDEILHVARIGLEMGLEGIFRSDHYDKAPNGKPSTDAWATLAGLACDLDRGVIGTLVSPVAFRHPGQLGKVVATVAHMSRGPSVEVGIGAGWNQREHDAYGFPFGSFGDRFAILEEYLPIVRSVLSGADFEFRGKHFTVEGGGSLPPAPSVRVIVGGGGPKRTPRLAAKYADELNLVMAPPAVVAERVKTCRQNLERFGRDPAAFSFSWMGSFLIGSDDADVRRRAEGAAKAFNRPVDELLSMMKGRMPAGTVQEASGFYSSLRDAGIDRVMLQHMSIDDDEHLRLAAEAAAAA